MSVSHPSPAQGDSAEIATQGAQPTREIKTRSPWGVWWLCLVTLSIYYLVWYVKVNREVAALSGGTVKVNPFALWFSQCVPIVGWVSLANTSERLHKAQAHLGQPETTTSSMSIMSSIWFWSNTRYLQRRLNETYRNAGIAS